MTSIAPTPSILYVTASGGSSTLTTSNDGPAGTTSTLNSTQTNASYLQTGNNSVLTSNITSIQDTISQPAAFTDSLKIYNQSAVLASNGQAEYSATSLEEANGGLTGKQLNLQNGSGSLTVFSDDLFGRQAIAQISSDASGGESLTTISKDGSGPETITKTSFDSSGDGTSIKETIDSSGKVHETEIEVAPDGIEISSADSSPAIVDANAILKHLFA